MWLVFAFGSALFAGLTAVLAKIGIKNVPSNLATALRTLVVLAFAWLMVLVVGSGPSIMDISPRSLLFLGLSGLATGASWLCYFRALALGNMNKVVPIDKSSTVLTMLLAFLFLGEAITPLKLVAMVAIGAGTLLMVHKQAAPAKTDMAPAEKVQAAPDSELAAHTATNTAVTYGTIKVDDAIVDGTVPAAGKDTNRGLPAGAGEPAAFTTANCADAAKTGRGWLFFALLSALFASLTAILGKVGIEGVESNLGTALRTVVVLVMAWGIALARGEAKTIRGIDRKSWVFLLLSGVATGLSWLCYYRALQQGPASVVVPIDKLSILITVLFGRLLFKEKLSRRALLGLVLIVVGTLSLLL